MAVSVDKKGQIRLSLVLQNNKVLNFILKLSGK